MTQIERGVVLSEKAWAAIFATARRTQSRAAAFAGLMPNGSKLRLYSGASLSSLSGATLIRTIDVAAWSAGSVQSDGRYPLVPGAFTDSGSGSGIPNIAVFLDDDGDEIVRTTAGVGEGVFQLGAALTNGVPITGGSFELLIQSDDIPTPEEPEPDPEEPPVIIDSYVDVMVSDMALFHDAPADVLDSTAPYRITTWGSAKSLPESYPCPTAWLPTAFGNFWFHAMETCPKENLITSPQNIRDLPWRTDPGPWTGNGGANTRLQIRDLQLWFLINGTWVRWQYRRQPQARMYRNDWGDNVSINNATWRDEESNGGGASVRDIGRGTYEHYNWHGWTNAIKEPPSYQAAASGCFARKILDNPNGVDDRSQAQLLLAVSGDYYRDEGVANNGPYDGNFGTTGPRGFSRFKLVSNDWQLFSWYANMGSRSLSAAQLRANPPPFTGLTG